MSTFLAKVLYKDTADDRTIVIPFTFDKAGVPISGVKFISRLKKLDTVSELVQVEPIVENDVKLLSFSSEFNGTVTGKLGIDSYIHEENCFLFCTTKFNDQLIGRKAIDWYKIMDDQTASFPNIAEAFISAMLRKVIGYTIPDDSIQLGIYFNKKTMVLSIVAYKDFGPGSKSNKLLQISNPKVLLTPLRKHLTNIEAMLYSNVCWFLDVKKEVPKLTYHDFIKEVFKDKIKEDEEFRKSSNFNSIEKKDN